MYFSLLVDHTLQSFRVPFVKSGSESAFGVLEKSSVSTCKSCQFVVGKIISLGTQSFCIFGAQ